MQHDLHAKEDCGAAERLLVRLPLMSCPSVQELPAEYIENQKKVDGPLLKAITPELKGYLASRFTLKAHDRPHLLKF